MARAFNGSNQYLARGSCPIPGEPFALAALVNSDGIDDDTPLAVAAAAGNNRHQIEIALGKRVMAYSNDGAERYAVSSAALTEGTWHSVVAMFVATNDRRAFLDGGNKGTNNTNTSVGAQTRMAVASDANASWHIWNGRIAEAAIWDLTDWDATAFENVVVVGLAKKLSPLFFSKGLVAYWPLIRDEDQDRVGGHDLTAYNSPTIAAHPRIIYPSPSSFMQMRVPIPVPVGAKAGIVMGKGSGGGLIEIGSTLGTRGVG